SPLAYPAGPLSGYVQQKAKARRAEATTKRVLLDYKVANGERSPVTALPGRAWVWTNRAYAKARAELVKLRVEKTQSLKERRRRMDSPIDQLSTYFWRTTMGNRSWRQLDPNLWAFELAYGPVIDRRKPNV